MLDFSKIRCYRKTPQWLYVEYDDFKLYKKTNIGRVGKVWYSYFEG
jgi:hypothetical protein